MKQKTGVGIIAGSASALALAVAVVGGFEGLRLTAYPDRLAHNIPTVCYGETRGVRLGERRTKAECDAMLASALVEFERGLDKCISRVLPVKVKVALVSWAYNVGTGAACRSTLVRLVNEGRLREACNELPKWNRAGGVVVRGLTNRRKEEQRLCLSAL